MDRDGAFPHQQQTASSSSSTIREGQCNVNLITPESKSSVNALLSNATDKSSTNRPPETAGRALDTHLSSTSISSTSSSATLPPTALHSTASLARPHLYRRRKGTETNLHASTSNSSCDITCAHPNASDNAPTRQMSVNVSLGSTDVLQPPPKTLSTTLGTGLSFSDLRPCPSSSPYPTVSLTTPALLRGGNSNEGLVPPTLSLNQSSNTPAPLINTAPPLQTLTTPSFSGGNLYNRSRSRPKISRTWSGAVSSDSTSASASGVLVSAPSQPPLDSAMKSSSRDGVMATDRARSHNIALNSDHSNASDDLIVNHAVERVKDDVTHPSGERTTCDSVSEHKPLNADIELRAGHHNGEEDGLTVGKTAPTSPVLSFPNSLSVTGELLQTKFMSNMSTSESIPQPLALDVPPLPPIDAKSESHTTPLVEYHLVKESMSDGSSPALLHRGAPTDAVAKPGKDVEMELADTLFEEAKQSAMCDDSLEAPLADSVSDASGVAWNSIVEHAGQTFTFNPSHWCKPSQWDDRLREINKRVFKHSSFRPLQREVILACAARRDVLAVMPTGQGKSLCYQMLTQLRDGLSIVISPLVALMDDQERELCARGIPSAALHSNNQEKHYEIFSRCMNGELKALIVSPERVTGRGEGVSDPLMRSLADIHLQASTSSDQSRQSKVRVSHIVVDEVHCVTTWGKSFRESLSRLGSLRDLFPGVPMLALTATATAVTIGEILSSLRLRDCVLFKAPFDRPNLTYLVRLRANGKDRIKAILDLYRTPMTTPRQQQPCGIVYCLTQRDCERMAQQLSINGAPAVPYHAGLPPHEKQANTHAWMRGDVSIMCATTAFGMGINKPNVRFVVHDTLPVSVEDYHQECGRAGRDGDPATCLLLYRYSDVTARESLHLLTALTKAQEESSDLRSVSSPDSLHAVLSTLLSRKETNREFPKPDAPLVIDPAILGSSGATLAEMRARVCDMYRYCAKRDVCRRQQTLSYFGEPCSQSNCRACDVCLAPVKLVNADVSPLILVLLAALRALSAATPSASAPLATHANLRGFCLRDKLPDQALHRSAQLRIVLAQTFRRWQSACDVLRLESKEYVFDEILFACIEHRWIEKQFYYSNTGKDVDSRSADEGTNTEKKENPFNACYVLTESGEDIIRRHLPTTASSTSKHSVNSSTSEQIARAISSARDLLTMSLPESSSPAPQHIADASAFTQSTFTQPNAGRGLMLLTQALASRTPPRVRLIPGRDGFTPPKPRPHAFLSQGSQKDFVVPRREHLLMRKQVRRGKLPAVSASAAACVVTSPSHNCDAMASGGAQEKDVANVADPITPIVDMPEKHAIASVSLDGPALRQADDVVSAQATARMQIPAEDAVRSSDAAASGAAARVIANASSERKNTDTDVDSSCADAPRRKLDNSFAKVAVAAPPPPPAAYDIFHDYDTQSFETSLFSPADVTVETSPPRDPHDKKAIEESAIATAKSPTNSIFNDSFEVNIDVRRHISFSQELDVAVPPQLSANDTILSSDFTNVSRDSELDALHRDTPLPPPPSAGSAVNTSQYIDLCSQFTPHQTPAHTRTQARRPPEPMADNPAQVLAFSQITQITPPPAPAPAHRESATSYHSPPCQSFATGVSAGTGVNASQDVFSQPPPLLPPTPLVSHTGGGLHQSPETQQPVLAQVDPVVPPRHELDSTGASHDIVAVTPPRPAPSRLWTDVSPDVPPVLDNYNERWVDVSTRNSSTSCRTSVRANNVAESRKVASPLLIPCTRDPSDREDPHTSAIEVLPHKDSTSSDSGLHIEKRKSSILSHSDFSTDSLSHSLPPSLEPLTDELDPVSGTGPFSNISPPTRSDALSHVTAPAPVDINAAAPSALSTSLVSSSAILPAMQRVDITAGDTVVTPPQPNPPQTHAVFQLDDFSSLLGADDLSRPQNHPRGGVLPSAHGNNPRDLPPCRLTTTTLPIRHESASNASRGGGTASLDDSVIVLDDDSPRNSPNNVFGIHLARRRRESRVASTSSPHVRNPPAAAAAAAMTPSEASKRVTSSDPFQKIPLAPNSKRSSREATGPRHSVPLFSTGSSLHESSMALSMPAKRARLSAQVGSSSRRRSPTTAAAHSVIDLSDTTSQRAAALRQRQRNQLSATRSPRNDFYTALAANLFADTARAASLRRLNERVERGLTGEETEPKDASAEKSAMDDDASGW